MARNYRTARGDVVDFDAIIIKQQIAQAPMNIEVARRKEFIDSKEGKIRGQRVAPTPEPMIENVVVEPVIAQAAPAEEGTGFAVEEGIGVAAPVIDKKDK